MEYNELLPRGVDPLAKGLIVNRSLRYLNVRGNAIRDEGLEMIAIALE